MSLNHVFVGDFKKGVTMGFTTGTMLSAENAPPGLLDFGTSKSQENTDPELAPLIFVRFPRFHLARKGEFQLRRLGGQRSI